MSELSKKGYSDLREHLNEIAYQNGQILNVLQFWGMVSRIEKWHMNEAEIEIIVVVYYDETYKIFDDYCNQENTLGDTQYLSDRAD